MATERGDMSGAATIIKEQAPTGSSLRVFGGIAILHRGEVVAIGGPRQRRMLALLAIRHGETVTLDWLGESLWNDDDRPSDPRASVHTTMSRLRRALPPELAHWIETTPGGYQLAVPADSVDHVRFDQLRRAARTARDRNDQQLALELLDEALGLWRGEPFRELEELDWAAVEITRLEADRLEMTEERFDVELALGRHTQILGELSAFTEQHRLRERAWRQLALAQHRAGRQADALQTLNNYRQQLVEHAGLDPSPELLDLEAKLLIGSADLDVGAISDADEVGRPLRGYRLIEEIGNGAFSIVWRGVQPSVDREVAIKQIRGELATRPEFIRRFEAEAHLIARIEHPHVVPLIDYWRDPDSAYLVMRWLRGGTVEQALDDGPWPVERTLRMLRQIGEALAEAHACEVIHRDVKTANIMLDERGNAFLGDFGIALDAVETGGPETALSHGSPAYAAPEQLRKEPLTPAADIFSLGVVAYECLSGDLPYPHVRSIAELVRHQLETPFPDIERVRPDVPAPVVEAINRATAKDPVQRFADMLEFVEALDANAPATAGPTHPGRRTIRTGDHANPYKGLRAFDEGDRSDFFGRERLVDELVHQLGGGDLASRCLTLVGPSGSGKSSVVRAGLLPAIRAGRVPGSERWYVTTLVPDAHPFESLEGALFRVAVDAPATLAELLRDGPRGILRGVRRCLPGEGDRILLVIDQLEELFTSAEPRVAAAFLEGLAVAVQDPTSPLQVVATLRADFYDRPLRHPGFAPILKNGAVDITPLAADELEAAITGPAERHGLELEPGLVARLAADAIGQAAPLPLLQYTLAELYERRVANVLTNEAFTALGGLAGSVAAKAEELHQESSEKERSATRTVFGRLVSPGGATADLRRRALVAEFTSSPDAQVVIERFGAARLLSFDRDAISREPTVEVAHEALLREWPRLGQWLDEDRELLQTIARLTGAVDGWTEAGRPATDLYRGGRLETARELADRAGYRLRPLDREFIEASVEAADAEHRAEGRRIRRLRRLVIGVAAALVAALIAGGVAFEQQQRADDETDRATAAAAEAESQAEIAETTRAAEISSLVATSTTLLSDDATLAGLLAVEAYQLNPWAAAPGLFQALAADPGLVEQRSVELPTGESSCGRLTESGIAVVTNRSFAGPVRVVTTAGARSVGGEIVCQVDISPDGTLIAAVTLDSHVVLLETATGDELARSPLERGVEDLRFSPTGEQLAVLHDREGEGFERGTRLDVFSVPGLGRVWDDDTFVVHPIRFAWHGDGTSIWVAQLSPNQRRQALQRVQAVDAEPIVSTEYVEDFGAAIVSAADGRSVAVVTGTGLIEIRSASDLEPQLTVPDSAFRGTPARAWFVFDDREVAVAQLDGTLSFISRESGLRTRPDLRLPALVTDVSGTEHGFFVVDATGSTYEFDLGLGGAAIDDLPLPERQIEMAREVGGVTADTGLRRPLIGPSAAPGAAMYFRFNVVTTIDLETREEVTHPGHNADDLDPYVGLADHGLAIGDFGLFRIMDRNGTPTTRFNPNEGLDGVLYVHTLAGDRAGTVAMLGREDRIGAPITRTRVPATGTDHLFIIASANDEPTRITLPSEASAVAVDQGVAVVGFHDGWVRTYAHDRADPLTEVLIEADSSIRAVSGHRNGWLAASETGRIHFVDRSAASDSATRLVTTGIDAPIDVQPLTDPRHAIVTDASGTMRLIDVDQGTQLGVLRDGPGWGDTLPIVDPNRDAVWVPSTRGLELVPTDPDGWARELCRRSTRRLTDEEIFTHVPPGLQTEVGSACTTIQEAE